MEKYVHHQNSFPHPSPPLAFFLVFNFIHTTVSSIMTTTPYAPRILLIFAFFIPALLTNVAAQTKCSPGSFVNATKCSPCPDNSISTTPNAKECTACPLGFTPTKRRTQCQFCPAGRFISAADGFECIPCELGKYNPRPGATDCITCPDAQITFELGAKSVLECGFCPKGMFLLFGEFDVNCSFCPIGQFSDEENATSCSVCEAGTFSNVGSSTCTPCPPGTRGLERPGKPPACPKCPKGTYQNAVGKLKCIPCPTGSKSIRVRKKCTPTCKQGAKNCRFCPPGTGYNAKTKSCNKCPKGMISKGNTSTPCWPCKNGLMPNKNQDRCICPDGLGFFDGACRQCPFNAVVVNNVRCKCQGELLLRENNCLCPSGMKPQGFSCVPCTAAERTELLEQFRGPCAFCNIGRFWNEKARRCDRCPPGTFIPTVNFARSCPAV